VLVDVLNRMEVTPGYELEQEVLDRAFPTLRVAPAVEPFTYAHNRNVAGFVAIDGPLAVDAVTTDVFALSWKDEQPYPFPPGQLVDQARQRIQEEGIVAMVMVPM
jgi:hypothetical protein